MADRENSNSYERDHRFPIVDAPAAKPRRPFPRVLAYLGIPFVAAAWLLAGRLVWEETVWSWARGPQMVGFPLIHSSTGAILVLAVLGSLLWALATLIAAVFTRSLGGRLGVGLVVAYAVAWGLLATPYGFWQRIFIERSHPEHAVEFFTYAAATGDLKTVKAFLEHGVDINAQGDYGTALHGASVEGELAVIEFLLARGADVNALNAYGDSPLVNATQAKNRAAETQALLKAHGAELIRGSEEQRNRAIEEQVQRAMARSMTP